MTFLISASVGFCPRRDRKYAADTDPASSINVLRNEFPELRQPDQKMNNRPRSGKAVPPLLIYANPLPLLPLIHLVQPRHPHAVGIYITFL